MSADNTYHLIYIYSFLIQIAKYIHSFKSCLFTKQAGTVPIHFSQGSRPYDSFAFVTFQMGAAECHGILQ